MESVTNFRDLAGIKNRDGQTIRQNKLLRSGELSRISKSDQITLSEKYALGKVLDLRSNEEVTARPDNLSDHTDYLHIDIFKNSPNKGSSLEDFATIKAAEQSHDYMVSIYKTMAVNADAQAGFTQVIESVLATAPGKSVLFHCFAGKDRTGVSAALLLEILNVPRETIYHDYLLTNQLRQKENKDIIEMARTNGLPTETLAALEIALNVDASYLDTFYTTITEEFGDMQVYLKNILHISDSMQNDLRKLMLTDH